MSASDRAAEYIANVIPELRDRIEERISDYCNERDWQKLRANELAGLAVEESAAALVGLALEIGGESR